MWNPLRLAAVSYAVRHADLVNTVSHHQQELLLALGVPASKVLTLSQGVESDRFTHDRSRHDAGLVKLLCTRRLEATYECVVVLRALSILKDDGVRFHCMFAAGGRQEPRLKREASALDVAGHVTFRGGYSQEELPRLLEEADVYVSAKPTDGTSMSLLEAMASGVFPVVTDIPANREWLTGRGDSVLVRRGNARELATGLRIAIENAQLRHDAVDMNRRRIQLSGERRKNLARLTRVYNQLVATYKRA
jgi:glycosyltransferase involved in cell wall biosynthesis